MKHLETNFHKLLIDGDIITRRAALAADSKKGGDLGVERAKQNADAMMTSLFMRLNSTNHVIYLGTPGDRTQHRFKIYPAYKENRKKIPYPKYFYDVRNHLIEKYNVEVVIGMESDDKLSIEQWKEFVAIKGVEEAKSIICTLDKDLDIVPGWHYNWMHDVHYWMNILDGLKCLYTQILKGDVVDNIPRIKAKVVLTDYYERIDFAKTEQQLLDIVRECMYNLEIENIENEIKWRGQVLYPLKEEGKLWEIPNL